VKVLRNIRLRERYSIMDLKLRMRLRNLDGNSYKDWFAIYNMMRILRRGRGGGRSWMRMRR